mgnify:FL=1
MGYMMLMAPCYICGRTFTSNPDRVPSVQRKHPVCKGCMEAINAKRVALGREPLPIPADAYEPAEE